MVSGLGGRHAESGLAQQAWRGVNALRRQPMERLQGLPASLVTLLCRRLMRMGSKMRLQEMVRVG